jgi:hypothetical protein
MTTGHSSVSQLTVKRANRDFFPVALSMAIWKSPLVVGRSPHPDAGDWLTGFGGALVVVGVARFERAQPLDHSKRGQPLPGKAQQRHRKQNRSETSTSWPTFFSRSIFSKD